MEAWYRRRYCRIFPNFHNSFNHYLPSFSYWPGNIELVHYPLGSISPGCQPHHPSSRRMDPPGQQELQPWYQKTDLSFALWSRHANLSVPSLRVSPPLHDSTLGTHPHRRKTIPCFSPSPELQQHLETCIQRGHHSVSQSWFKVAVSVIDSEGYEAYRYRCLGSVSGDT